MADVYISPQPFVYITGPGGPFTSSSSSGGGGLEGTGSPEGVQTAAPGTTYYDSSTGQFWVKNSGTGSVGWTLLVS